MVRPDSGGRANEAGSVYRAGVAAYLAAHGLAGVPIESLQADGYPTRISLETGAAVDDLRCEFSTGASVEIQAKNGCGFDGAFRSVVAQWVGAASSDELELVDSVALVTRVARGDLRDLGAALTRRRETTETRMLPAEERAFARLNPLLTSLSDEQRERLLAKARILELAVNDSEQAAFREAGRLLEGAVVPIGRGLAAMAALRDHFHELSVGARGSDTDRWLRILRDAGLEILAEAGSPASRAQAFELSLDAYKMRLAQRLNLLPLTLLADDLPPMPVHDLLSQFHIDLGISEHSTSLHDDLRDVARRWGRMILEGLPGTGKSVALEQLAASWCNERDAPTPVLVRLKRLNAHLDAEVPFGLADLLATAEEVRADDETLLGALSELAHAGDAVLLLDGFDECRAPGLAAASIASLVAALPGNLDVVISTREFALPPLKRLNLPIVSMRTPVRLDGTIDELLTHVAQNRIPAAERNSWLALRRAWIAEARRGHRAVWDIPLLASLLTLLVCSTTSDRLPTTRASSLAAVVADSVRRWELRRATEQAEWDRELRPELLVHGFGLMSRKVLSGTHSVPDVVASIAQGINSDWALPMPRASALANDVFRLWEEQAGVFAVSEDVVVPRTKLLAEVGDAMWVSDRSDAEVDAWLRDALPEADRHESVKLAAALAPGIANALITASAGSGVSLLVASDAVLEGASPSEASLAQLVEMLVEAAARPLEHRATTPESTSGLARILQSQAEARAELEGPVWKYLTRLGRLSLPAHLRARRDRALGEIKDPEREAVLRALAAAADIGADDRHPTEVEQGHLRALVNLSLPEDDHWVEHVSRRHMVIHGSSGLLSGHIEALEAAIPLIPLDRDEAKRVLAAGQRSSMGAASRIHRALIGAGHREVVTEHYRDHWPDIPAFDLKSGWAEFLDLLETSWDPSNISRSQRWRLESLGELVEELGLRNLAVGEFEVAVTRRPDLVEFIARVTARALRLDLPTVAAEAVAVRPLVDVGLNDAAGLLFVPPPPRDDQDDRAIQLTGVEREQLRDALVAGSDWLFNVSARWLSQDSTTHARELLRSSLEGLVARHRLALAKYLANVADNGEEMAALWIAGSDDILRSAAAYVIGRHGTHRDQLESLVSDDDLTVRSHARAGLNATVGDRNLLSDLAATRIAQFWCCTHCGVRQKVDATDCRSCSTGTRPEATTGDTP